MTGNTGTRAARQLSFAGQRLLESASDRTERGIRRVAIDTDLAALLNHVAQDHLPEGSLREAAADVFGTIAAMSSSASPSRLGDWQSPGEPESATQISTHGLVGASRERLEAALERLKSELDAQ